MDPQACLQRLSQAIHDGRYSEAISALADYYKWRVRGGFEPPNGDNRVEMLAARLADKLEEISL